MKIAVVGTGISGLSAAWALSQRHEVSVFEQNHYVGGHTNTVLVRDADGESVPIDTGFIVFNERNYPQLTALFKHLTVPTQAANMSFAASIGDGGGLEYSGQSLNSLFGQRRNVIKPKFYRMLADILRFNRDAIALLQTDNETLTLGQFLTDGDYSHAFQYQYLLPMGAAIWSCPLTEMLSFPARSFVQFFHNHGLLQLHNRPQWRTVCGGSWQYVHRLTRPFVQRLYTYCPIKTIHRHAHGVTLVDVHQQQADFDLVVLATHADQALSLLAQPDPEEQRLLSCFSYQRNRTVLHSDPQLMPKRHRVWSAWNYLAHNVDSAQPDVSVTYWMNRLQNLPTQQPFFVSLNPLTEPKTIHRECIYEHPLFTAEAMAAQKQLPQLQGASRTWFCGSYFGYGFHEDGLKSGLAVAEALGVTIPWETSQQANMTANVVSPVLSPTPIWGQ